MPLKNFSQIVLPYCLEEVAENQWVVTNREYKPCGFKVRDHVKYEQFPIVHRFKGLTDKRIDEIACHRDIDPSGLRIFWLYIDSCPPDKSQRDFEAYTKRLAKLMTLEVDEPR